MRPADRRGPATARDGGSQSRALRITTRNSAFQVLLSLRDNRQKRHAAARFIVEGVRPISLAVEYGWEFDAVAYDPGRTRSPWAAGILAKQPSATRYEVAPALLAELSGKDDTSELLAVVRMRPTPVSAIEPRADLLAVVLDRPGNPGNLGTLIRSSDALGAHAVVVTGHAADPHEPAALTASRGSFFALPVCTGDAGEVEALVARTASAFDTCQLIGADESGSVDAADCDLRVPTVLVVGNETHGLSRAYRERCDVLVRIPMAGAASSLNVAVAGSILLYEARRQRARRTP
jgi:TrmH family RNA methyltransferase